MTDATNRPVAQVGHAPELLAFGEEVRRHGLMAGGLGIPERPVERADSGRASVPLELERDAPSDDGESV